LLPEDAPYETEIRFRAIEYFDKLGVLDVFSYFRPQSSRASSPFGSGPKSETRRRRREETNWREEGVLDEGKGAEIQEALERGSEDLRCWRIRKHVVIDREAFDEIRSGEERYNVKV